MNKIEEWRQNELTIGSTFKYKGKTYEVQKQIFKKDKSRCVGCVFEIKSDVNCNDVYQVAGHCCGYARKDMTSVIFKEKPL